MTRSLGAALLVLILALRALAATGYMPALGQGEPAIVVCPDADANAPLSLGAMPHHHHGKTKHDHAQCPYAAASALGALGPDFGALLDVLILAAALLLSRSFLFLERHASRERPPARAPPIPA